MSKLFGEQLAIVNLGLASFADAARQQGAAVIHPAWQPPASGDRDTGLTLAAVFNHPAVEAANAQAFAAYLASQPAWVGIGRAGEVIPGMDGQMILHSGPPIAWDDMCGPVQGAIVGLFFIGGLCGAWAFQWVGVVASVPLALLLIAMALAPLSDDWRVWRRWRRMHPAG